MKTKNNSRDEEQKIRVLRIAHSSLTPALRCRERALVQCFPDIDLEVVTTPSWKEAEVEVKATADDLFPVRTARSYFSKHIQLFAYDPRPIIKALREHQPHLIDLSHEPYSVACAQLLTLCGWFAPGVPIVMQTNQNILHKYPPPFNWLEQRAFRRVHGAYACSETVVEVLRAKGFDKPAPIVPFGVNTEAFRPPLPGTKKADGPLTIGFVGRMLPGKGLGVLADALAEIRALPWKLLMVGDGPVREEFEQKLRAASLMDRAEFTGAISFDQVPKLFHQMDVMVLPTETTARIREQFGRVLVEAMASAVPVIGSTCGAIPEVISDAGLVFTERNSSELADALRRTLTDEALRNRMVAAGLERVKEYSWERVAEKTYELYQLALRTAVDPVVSSQVELVA
jgi:glycosyltransferase involved in cell wall biosynthesis